MDYCIYETDDEYKAKMLIDILKDENILTYTVNMGLQNLYGDSKLWTGTDLIVGGIKIYIKQNDIEKAKQIIDEIPFLKNNYKTIEDDNFKKDTYFIQRSFLFSFLSIFIIPFFFNLEYIIYSFKNNIKAKYYILIFNVLSFFISIFSCIVSFDYLKLIWRWNLLFTLVFSIIKYIDLNKKQSKLKYTMIIPIILLILSYNIAYQVFGIILFGY